MAKRSSKPSKSKSASGGFTAQTRLAAIVGPDDLLARQHLNALIEALQAEHGEIELHRFDGRTAELADVLDELRCYSLLQQYKLVILEDAGQFLNPRRKGGDEDDEDGDADQAGEAGSPVREVLERYVDSPVDHATLVLRAPSGWRKNTRLHKKIAKVGVVVDCNAPAPHDAARWLQQRAESEYDCTIAPAAASALVERLGTESIRLDTELAKLSLMIDPGQTITPQLVREVVGRSSDEQAWAVQEAVLQSMASGSAGAAIEKLHELIDAGDQPDVLVMYFVADLARKFALADAMRRAGMKPYEASKPLKLWGDRQRLFWQVMDRIGGREAQGLFDQALRADAGAKSGRGDFVMNLEVLTVSMADVSR